ncbi:Hypothetical predicted protein, partial [Pelobates cultripes]
VVRRHYVTMSLHGPTSFAPRRHWLDIFMHSQWCQDAYAEFSLQRRCAYPPPFNPAAENIVLQEWPLSLNSKVKLHK